VTAGVVLGLQILAGHAQTTWYGLVLAIAFSLAMTRGWGLRDLLRWAGGWALATGVAFALAAAQLLPAIEYLLESSRAGGLDAEAALTYSFWPWRALGLVAPGLFGSPGAGDYWGYGNYWEDAMYIGVLPILMALTALVRSRTPAPARRRATALLGAAALIGFALGLGANTPLYPLLYRWLPTFDLFNAPTRWNIVTVMALCLLAGFGTDIWAPPSPRGRYWRHLAVAGSLAISGVALAARLADSALRPSVSWSFVLLGLLLAAAALLQLRWPSVPGPRWAVVVAVLIGADLLQANSGLLPSVSPELYRAPTDLRANTGDGHRLYLPADLEYEIKFQRTHRFDTFDPGIDWIDVREAGLPNAPMIDGLPSANNFDPLLTAAYVEWIDMLEATDLDPEILALGDIGWVARPDGEAPPWVEYASMAEARRVRVIPRSEWVPGRREALARVGDENFDAVVLLEGEAPTGGAAQGGLGEAEILPGDDPGVVIVRADAPQGGWLLLSDAWYPGWTADVDGQPSTIHRADGLFRSVWLPPGNHIVTFAYRPWTFAAGCLIAAIAWGAVLAVGRRWRGA
jgi:hypothetical protein